MIPFKIKKFLTDKHVVNEKQTAKLHSFHNFQPILNGANMDVESSEKRKRTGSTEKSPKRKK